MKPCDEPCPKCGGDDVYRHLLIKGKRVHPPNAAATHPMYTITVSERSTYRVGMPLRMLLLGERILESSRTPLFGTTYNTALPTKAPPPKRRSGGRIAGIPSAKRLGGAVAQRAPYARGGRRGHGPTSISPCRPPVWAGSGCPPAGPTRLRIVKQGLIGDHRPGSPPGAEMVASGRRRFG